MLNFIYYFFLEIMYNLKNLLCIYFFQNISFIHVLTASRASQLSQGSARASKDVPE